MEQDKQRTEPNFPREVNGLQPYQTTADPRILHNGKTETIWRMDPAELGLTYDRAPAAAVRRPNPPGACTAVAAATAGGLVLQRTFGSRLLFGALWLEVAPGAGVEVRHTAHPDKPVKHVTHGAHAPRFLGVPAEYLPGILRAVREYTCEGLPLGNAAVTVRHGAHCERGSSERLFYDLTQRVLDLCLHAARAEGALTVHVQDAGHVL